VGIFGSLRNLCFGGTSAPTSHARAFRNPQSEIRNPKSNSRRCQIEELEPRRLFATDVVPHVLLGSVYFEEATGDDSKPDVIQVSFAGGAAGTTLNHLTINGDKRQDGLTDGDVFFDTAAGGLGAFHYDGLTIASADGFTVTGAHVTDGGSLITFDFTGFDAGEKLVFNIDADEAQFVDGPNVDSNSLVEGEEFQRSIMTGQFSAVGYVDLTLSGLYWDQFDGNFATAYSQTGLSLDLPNDAYTLDHDYSDRTAGAIAHAAQIPLASISGWVYHDHNDDGIFQHGTEEAIGGVTLELLDANGAGTGITTTTSTNPSTLGFYEFKNLVPGTYGVREVQPNGWLDGKDAAGDHGGVAAPETAGRVDRITGAVLNYGDHGLDYNFGELLPGSISGIVEAHHDADCNFDEPPEITLQGVRVDLLDANGTFIRSTLTDENGFYEFANLAPGIYQVFEHQPTDYYEGQEHVGSVGGSLSGQDHFVGINIGSDVHGVNYDFCEHIGVMLSGNVYHDRDDDGNFDRPAEEGISGVLLKLIDGSGHDTGLRATTDANGFYKFNNLAAGVYTVMEIQPVAWLDGKDTPGNSGGVAAVSPPGDMISQITLDWGVDGIEYNFGELLPGSIAGHVQICNDDLTEGGANIPIPNVRVDLLDGSGNLIDFTTTNGQGEYSFTNLRPGTYRVFEHQPAHYFEDEAHIGSGDGVIVGASLISTIHIGSDQDLVNYDFCELPPGSISGRVVICDDEAAGGEADIPIPNVRVDLLDSRGQVVQYTTTNSNGEYSFANLPPGTYRVLEHQPNGFYDDEAHVGSGDGVIVNPSFITDIHIGAGQDLVEYDFCEVPPSSIRGQVQAHSQGECNFQDPELVLSGVVIELRDGEGHLLETTTTDADGRYVFDNLHAGTYTVHEIQPSDYFNDDLNVGSVGGQDDGNDSIVDIHLPAGNNATDYDFCEVLPGSIAGQVQAHKHGDCNFAAPEFVLSGVTIELRDADGRLLATTTTDANGRYVFNNLKVGTYTVHEIQPAGYFDDDQNVGSVGGLDDRIDSITNIHLPAGTDATDYDFCEVLPGSIAGQVQAHTHGECNFQNPEIVLSGVTIELRDGEGHLLATTTTDSEGRYVFNNLAAGTYSVHEIQPNGYFDDDENVGSSGGELNGDNSIINIQLATGVDATDYDFCEVLPGSIAGHVRICDDEAAGGAADIPIANVGVDLLDSEGHLLETTTTNGNGEYSFTNLRPGTYRVFEHQPAGFDEDEVHVGSGGGIIVNMDLISAIPLESGHDLVNYDFCEIPPPPPKIPPPPPIPPTTPPPPPKPPVFPPFVPPVPPLVQIPPLPTVPKQPYFGEHDNVVGYTWHLSVVNAGWPRNVSPAEAPQFQLTAAQFDVSNWQNVPLNRATWTLAILDGSRVVVDRIAVFGTENATPVTGDFNGDGVTDIGVFIDGQWFLDLNGNGRWDEGDLWVKLGSEDDLPVTGDWDADGKTDIGIYGPAWPRDPWAISVEPGLPDADNFPSHVHSHRKFKNMPPKPEDATDGNRMLRRTARGKNRADFIDHVFHYGEPGDVPVSGDWNGDGIRQIGVFHDGQWYLDLDGDGKFTERDAAFTFGQAGDLPVVGDFNGNGVDVVGVFRAGKWIIDTNNNHHIDAQDKVFELGGAGDKPVVGDWNDDGADDPGVFHPGATTTTDHVAKRAG
jgi:serine-aspartate repeat-containing protein C/D/E